MEPTWTHSDELGLRQSVTLGMQRARSGDWSSGTLAERVRAFRGYVLERALLMGALAGRVDIREGSAGTSVRIDPWLPGATEERSNAAIVLYRTAVLLAPTPLAEGNNLATRAGPGDTGIAWPIVAGVVVVGLGYCAALGYGAFQAANVVDRQLQRNQDLKLLAQGDAQVLLLVREHAEREKAAGKPLPLNDATKSALGTLADRQSSIAKRVLPPLSSGIPALPSVPSFAAGAGVATILILGTIAYFYFND